MAGNILYSGEMFQSMIEKLDQTIAALNDVNTVVSQGVTSMMVASSDNIALAIDNEQVIANAPTGNAEDTKIIYKAKAYMDGTLTFRVNAKGQVNYASSTVQIKAVVTAGLGTGITINLTQNPDDFEEVEGEITVASGAEITIQAYAKSANISGQPQLEGATVTVEADSLQLKYDMINIVEYKGLIPITN